jgi:hypothetical protein
MYSEALLKQTAWDCQNLFVISRVCNNRDNNRLKQAEPNQLSVCYNQKIATTKFFIIKFHCT